MSEPTISVVMATYGRANSIARTIEHLAAQSLDSSRFEVVIADDASPDDTERIVEAWARRAPCQLTYLRNRENRGFGFTQNRAIRAARGRLVLIMPDDVWMSPSALEQHVAFHEAHPDPATAALGKVLQSPELDETVFLRNWEPWKFSQLEGADELPYYLFWPCNLSCKRDFMLGHGMFREYRDKAGPDSFEDMELGHRLHRSGLSLRYHPDACAFHHHAYTLDRAIERWYQRGLSYDGLRRRAPDPGLDVFCHVLTWNTLPGYVRTLRSPNVFHGREASLAWHLFRHIARLGLLNRWTASRLWRPLLDAAEEHPWVATWMRRGLYRAFLYYHFLRGVRDGRGRPLLEASDAVPDTESSGATDGGLTPRAGRGDASA